MLPCKVLVVVSLIWGLILSILQHIKEDKSSETKEKIDNFNIASIAFFGFGLFMTALLMFQDWKSVTPFFSDTYEISL